MLAVCPDQSKLRFRTLWVMLRLRPALHRQALSKRTASVKPQIKPWLKQQLDASKTGRQKPRVLGREIKTLAEMAEGFSL